MPNPLTRVPVGPPPSARGRPWVVRLADLGMRCFLSTPESGSLESTWVTPATLWSSCLVVVGAIAVVILSAIYYKAAWPLWVVAVIWLICCALGILCAAIAAVGLLQRVRSRDASSR
jgi:hypothetical protein